MGAFRGCRRDHPDAAFDFVLITGANHRTDHRGRSPVARRVVPVSVKDLIVFSAMRI
jgi:hypothetical protein